MQQSRFEKYLDEATAHLPEAERSESRAELETHLTETARLRRAQGLSETEADAEALRHVGNARQVNRGLLAVSLRGLLWKNDNRITLFWQVVLGVSVSVLAINAQTMSGMVGISHTPFVLAGLPFFASGVLVGRGPRRPFIRLIATVVLLFIVVNILRGILVGSWSWARFSMDPIRLLLLAINWLAEYIVAVPGVLLGLWLKKVFRRGPHQPA